jgi:hypothetical protein
MMGRQTDDEVIDGSRKQDYYTPSLSVFVDHCDHVASRYNLKGDDTIEQGRVTDIQYDFVDLLPGIDAEEKVFTVTTDKNEVHYAKVVVLAVGPANKPNIPASIMEKVAPKPTANPPHMCHSMNIKTYPDPVVRNRVKAGRQTNILIIGGGLTSAQLADLAIKRGVSRVWLITRGPWRTRLFDVDLEWMGKFRNREHAMFHQLDTDAERLARYCSARAGGSIPSYYYKVMEKHERAGKLQRFSHTRIDTPEAELMFDSEAGMWAVKTDPPILDMPKMDFIYLATGIQSTCQSLPYLQSIQQRFPIQFEGGFPCLTDDLMWADDVPLFFNGRLAGLRIGPAAPNLGGVRVGAERIAWKIEAILEARRKSEDANAKRLEYFMGYGSRFSALGDLQQSEQDAPLLSPAPQLVAV